MNNPVILVVLDGLNYRTAHDCMGFMQGLAESERHTVQPEL